MMRDLYRGNTGAWFESRHCKIYPKERENGVITPHQNYLQQKIQSVLARQEDMGLPVRIIGLKPRQKGSTTYFSAAVYTWLRRKSASAVIIGGQYNQVKEAWDMLQTYQKHDTLDWRNTGEINTKSGHWSNGSKLIQETAGDVVAGIGGTHQVLHAFEVARWGEHGVSNTGNVLINITKSVPDTPGSMIILESTAEGSAGEFYDRWIRAVDAEDFLDGTDIKAGQYVRVFAPWFEFDDSAMALTQEECEAVEASLDTDPQNEGEQDLIDTFGQRGEDGIMRLGTTVQNFNVWEQLSWRRLMIEEKCKRSKEIFDRDYPKSWQTAFMKSGAQRFNILGLTKQRLRLAKRPPPTHGVIELGKSAVNFRKTTEGEATHTIFEKPIPGCRYLVSVDPMTGITQVGGKDPDQHGVFCLRAGYWNSQRQWVRMATAARVIQCRWDIDIVEEAVWKLARMYGGPSGAMIAVEMNQDRGIVELLKLRSANLYMREFFNQRETRMSKAIGYQTNEKSREVLVEDMARVIREWDKAGEGIDIWCPLALEQAENFVRKTKGRSEHADGWHDDDVLAIALGVTLIDHATIYHPPINPYQRQPWEQVGAQRGPSQYS